MADQDQQGAPPPMPTGPFEDPIPIENHEQVTVIVISTLSLLVPAIFVALRLYAKSVTNRSVDKSDYCIIVALVSGRLWFSWDTGGAGD